jgi:ABC-2 type transport system permease protein
MSNLLIVARHEFLTMIRRRSFILSTVGMPVVFGLIIGVMILVVRITADPRPVGYVDHSGLVAGVTTPPGIQSYPDEQEAFQALEEGQLRAVYVVAQDYVQSQQVDLYYWDSPPGSEAWARINAYLRTALLEDVPPAVRARIESGPTITIYSADRTRSLSPQDPFAVLLPVLAAVLLMIASMSASGSLLQAVTAERIDRTIEVLISTISPYALLGGKILGLMAAILLQLGVWLASLIVAWLVVIQLQPGLPALQIPWPLLGLIAIFFLPAFGLIAALMTAVGGVVRDISQGQLIAGMLTLPFIVPVMAISLILTNPSSPLVIFMTYFPLTAFITTVIRAGIGVAPAGQVALSWLLLMLTAVLTGWLGALIFRAGMLRYGQGMNLGQVLNSLRRAEGQGR